MDHDEVRKARILCARVRKETGKGKDRFKIQDLFVDASQAALDVLSATDVGRGVPASAEEDTQSEGVRMQTPAEAWFVPQTTKEDAQSEDSERKQGE